VREFSEERVELLRKAQAEIHWLLNHDYPTKNVVEFVGNHYLFSKRQRLALTRATAPTSSLVLRKSKKLDACENQIVHIDGLNLIITLEVALSESTLLKCMDETVRDLAGLRGTYRLIDKTDKAIILIGEKLDAMNVAEAVFYLDAPVSNTGRLKRRILDLLANYKCEVSVEVIDHVDKILKSRSHVITTDSIILNECESWINFAAELIDADMSEVRMVNLY
jgi:hypothetical protein